jgi:hypothetical protein
MSTIFYDWSVTFFIFFQKNGKVNQNPKMDIFFVHFSNPRYKILQKNKMFDFQKLIISIVYNEYPSNWWNRFYWF